MLLTKRLVMKINNVEITTDQLHMTPSEAANFLIKFGSREWVEFFNSAHQILRSGDLGYDDIAKVLNCASIDKKLTPGGRRFVRLIHVSTQGEDETNLSQMHITPEDLKKLLINFGSTEGEQ